jgi:alpha-glucoside transport system substrate-binding protein
VGTDWLEEILLRTAPPEAYDAWVRGELKFDSPEIRRAFAIMESIWLGDGFVYGGTENILEERFFTNSTHLFEDPPGCYLHKQATFIQDFFPEDVEYARDYDFFPLPPIDPEYGQAVLGGGDIQAMFNDRPEVREVMRYLTTGESVKDLVQAGSYISPHRDTPFDWYSSPADLRFAQMVLEADTYRYDGSDLMPPEVGVDAFWKGIVAWVEGEDLETVLRDIDSSWPDWE